VWGECNTRALLMWTVEEIVFQTRGGMETVTRRRKEKGFAGKTGIMWPNAIKSNELRGTCCQREHFEKL